MAAEGTPAVRVRFTPAAPGWQLVRFALPLPEGMLPPGGALQADDGRRQLAVACRPLTRHPGGKWVRRALVTFPYRFAGRRPVAFTFLAAARPPRAAPFPVAVSVQADQVSIAYAQGPRLVARLVSPARESGAQPWVETVEDNAGYRWQRVHLGDGQWPAVIELRADALGGVVVTGHLQRRLPGDGWAPELGWQVEIAGQGARLQAAGHEHPVGPAPVRHAFAGGRPCALDWAGGYRLYHPAAPLKRKGEVAASQADGALHYSYRRWAAGERVPMQQASWQRVELAVAPPGLAPVTAALQSPHAVRIPPQAWASVDRVGRPLDLRRQPELAALADYHHQAILGCLAQGDDWGNLTAYSDGSDRGAAFGMNRLNHGPAIFAEGYRSGDRRLVEAALLCCDNFYDQSIWWGSPETGGTRYNNLLAMGGHPPDGDQSYMWRSNTAVTFCTKGFDSFLLAYEETGDPRMLEALRAQVAYAREFVHADRGEARNVGVAQDFVRLYELTGEASYLEQARRLFAEIRSKLSAGSLFSQGGEPIEADPPYIEEDAGGYGHPFAKPYIIGYGLAGVPDLGHYLPAEPGLREMVAAIADFLADSQDPVGGWRYPHPRSSYMILNQALEHAWQLVQADRLLGPQERHLDAIERVLRQRLWGWLQSGKLLAGLTGWETATGAVKDRAELYQRYRRPADRDPSRDYSEGRPELGSSTPEGLVYLPEVLAFYLEHRPAARLLAPPRPDEPLGRVLARVPRKTQ